MKYNSIYDDMSEAEKKVAYYLKELDIIWNFESPVFVADEIRLPLKTKKRHLDLLAHYSIVLDSNHFETILARITDPL